MAYLLANQKSIFSLLRPALSCLVSKPDILILLVHPIECSKKKPKQMNPMSMLGQDSTFSQAVSKYLRKTLSLVDQALRRHYPRKRPYREKVSYLHAFSQFDRRDIRLFRGIFSLMDQPASLTLPAHTERRHIFRKCTLQRLNTARRKTLVRPPREERSVYLICKFHSSNPIQRLR